MLRRSFLQGLGALFVAPAIVRASNLMPVKEYMPAVPAWCPEGWLPLDGREIKAKYYPDLYTQFKKLRFPMQLDTDQGFTNYSGYEVIETALKNRVPSFKRIISAKDLIRPNGSVMKAGSFYTIQVKEEV